MNIRFLTIAPLIASSFILMTGCSEDNSSFETPNLNPEIITNSGIVSQKNFELSSSPSGFPAVINIDAGTFTPQTVEIIATIGDRKNQLLTDEHVVFFKTEWGLIQPSCTTEEGTCSVTWQTSKSENIPASLTNVVVAWTVGEETFTDTNGNGKFDDADTAFEDLEEPFLDINLNGVFDAGGGDELIDVINGNDLTGINGVHDIGDTFLNSPNCTHAFLCSTVKPTLFIWSNTYLVLTGLPDATP